MSEELKSLFKIKFGFAPEAVEPLALSGSSRRYFRLRGGGSRGRVSSEGFDAASSEDGTADCGRTGLFGGVGSASSEGGTTCIGVLGENVPENEAFIHLAEHFRSRGLNVPEVYAVSDDRRYYIQQDLGSVSLFDAVAAGRERAQREFCRKGAVDCGEAVSSQGGADCSRAASSEGMVGGKTGDRATEPYSAAEEELLCRTIAELPKIQFEGARGLDFNLCFPVPQMSVRSIMFDLNYFKYCYLLPIGLEYDEARLQDEFEKLAADLLAEPFDTFMYRDFQTRNVMLLGGEPWFIDFQGGRRGPVYYDVASFVWQARSCFPAALRAKLIDTYLAALERYRPVERAEFMTRLRIFLLFRMMQVLGAYGFRGLYQRKPHFMRSIPYALANLKELLSEPFENYPYLSALLREVAGQTISPAAVQADGGQTEWSGDGQGRKGVACKDGRPAAVQTSSAEFLSEAGAGSKVARCGRPGGGQSECNAAVQAAEEGKRLTVKVKSFSYKDGIPQDDSGNGGGYVFDCRGMNNPGRYERYGNSTGRDADVIEFLETDGGVFAFLDGVYAMVDPHVETFISRGFTSLCINFGCTGGRHRSVYCAEALARHLAEKFPAADILLTHTRLNNKQELIHADGKQDGFENGGDRGLWNIPTEL